jgi:hypothetical protein
MAELTAGFYAMVAGRQRRTLIHRVSVTADTSPKLHTSWSDPGYNQLRKPLYCPALLYNSTDRVSDINQSPFNVGTRLQLDDFSIDQVAELNRLYGTMLQSNQDPLQFFSLVGDYPYLANKGLSEMKTHGFDLETLVAEAHLQDGVFSHHMERLLITLNRDKRMAEAVVELLRGRPCPSAEIFYRLRTAGVIVGQSMRDARLR